MDQRKQSLQQQILKLLESKSTPEEAAAFLQLPPQELDAFLNEKEWDELSPEPIPEELRALWLENTNKKKAPPVRRMYWKYWMSAAAVLLLIVGTVLYLNKRAPDRVEIAKNNAREAVLAPQHRVVLNQGNTIRTYTLSDSSVVELSPGSTLRYVDPMETNSRSLWLQGEGVFHVVHDSRRPFTVYTEGLVTTDLGTVFKITAYKNKNETEVQLISGEIAVHSLHDTAKIFYLTAGQRCRFDQAVQSLQMVRNEVLADAENQKERPLIKDEINFHNTPVPEVLHQLSKTHNVPIAFSNDSLRERKFTGSFKKNANLEKVLETILLLSDLKKIRIADTIYVSPK
jgi:transmembrane sensor